MPKIRGVKPELWTDEDFVELSPYARLLWVGLWNYACDNGHLQDKSKQIKMRILPTDDVNCADLLREIESQGLITRADGWITIPNLSHHQKPHKRWWTTCDKEDCELPEGASHAPANRGTTVAPPKGNRCATADGDGDGDGDGEGEELLVRPPASADGPAFDDFWELYPRKDGKGQARRAWKAALKKSHADTITAGLESQLKAMANSERRFIPMPATWLNGERWADEAASAVATRAEHSWATAIVLGPCDICGGDVDIDNSGHRDGCPKRRRA